MFRGQAFRESSNSWGNPNGAFSRPFGCQAAVGLRHPWMISITFNHLYGTQSLCNCHAVRICHNLSTMSSMSWCARIKHRCFILFHDDAMCPIWLGCEGISIRRCSMSVFLWQLSALASSPRFSRAD